MLGCGNSTLSEDVSRVSAHSQWIQTNSLLDVARWVQEYYERRCELRGGVGGAHSLTLRQVLGDGHYENAREVC